MRSDAVVNKLYACMYILIQIRSYTSLFKGRRICRLKKHVLYLWKVLFSRKKYEGFFTFIFPTILERIKLIRDLGIYLDSELTSFAFKNIANSAHSSQCIWLYSKKLCNTDV